MVNDSENRCYGRGSWVSEGRFHLIFKSCVLSASPASSSPLVWWKQCHSPLGVETGQPGDHRWVVPPLWTLTQTDYWVYWPCLLGCWLISCPLWALSPNSFLPFTLNKLPESLHSWCCATVVFHWCFNGFDIAQIGLPQIGLDLHLELFQFLSDPIVK